MAIERPDDRAEPGGPLPAVTDRLGYLLKHAHLRFAELSAAAMEPMGISGRECAVLIAIDDRVPQSQQEVARRLAVDRTTMVALIDELERKGLVDRRQAPGDRRKNVVTLTAVGRATVAKAVSAGAEAERRFLASLSDADAAAFRRLLRSIVLEAPDAPRPDPGDAPS
jgi:DNA-binding MarR family transcriptional regulator